MRQECVIDSQDQSSGPPTFQVTTATGGYATLLHQREKSFYEQARDKYLTDYSWSTENDKRSIDRLLSLETQMFRIQDFLNRGSDYQGVDFTAGESTDLRRAQKEIGAQISVLQTELGLTKVQRDKDRHDSVGSYIIEIQTRAKELGIKREKELGKALELMHELFATIGAFRRSNTTERARLQLETADDVVKWIEGYIEPEFKAVDAYFREHQQKFWIRSM